MTNGKLIVLEGIDGSGTSTQIELLSSYLRSLDKRVLVSKEPTDGPIGRYTRELLKKNLAGEEHLSATLALCFAADRMEHIHNIIMPALKVYDFILLDRYVLSSLVYQGLHHKLDFIKAINQYAILPDFTILLDIDEKIAIERINNRSLERDFFEEISLLKRLRNSYLELVKKEKHVIIDASNKKEEVLQSIICEIKNIYAI